ncbi:MAG: hypothetical protein IKM23_09620 [Bacteroidales bacterium]|nr:hypothetical protein [Bacteroidales bacterium]
MEQKNNEQNSVIFSIAEILGKMSNQVSFLIRNNKLMSQLDVDMLMENTRKLYDTVCSVRCNMDVDSIPMEVEDSVGTGTSAEGENIEMVWDFTEDDVDEDENVVDENMVDEDIDDEDVEEEDALEVEGDEECVEKEDATEEEQVEDESAGDDAEEEDSGIRAYKKVNNEYFTIGDALEQSEDKSLAARLQRKPITDLSTSIGINDKFLLLNELFGGSMEKYNKSIKALNNFPTLMGAKTYMSELQIEFQWDCESEAYKKLSDLVERRFISIHNS